jgi:hypothetical protein
MAAERLSVIVAGGMGAMPFAGIAWQTLPYLEGLRRLGHRVFYLEDTGRWPYDPDAVAIADDASAAIAYTAAMVGRVGLGDDWAYRDVATGTVYGSTEAELRAWLDEADALINLSGMTILSEDHLRVPVRVFLDTDPGLAQIKIDKGEQDAIDWVAAHTHHFSWGENLGTPECDLPTGPFHYRPTRQPVILDWWHPVPDDLQMRAAFTTVASWKQTGKDIKWRGELWTWSKDVQFLRYIDLPRRVEQPLELALAAVDRATVARLERAGWGVVPAVAITKDPDAYRRYIQSSAGEFSVAKDQYVRPRTGWLSDRTASYLAAGKPVIVEDTGSPLPHGEGLFAFSDMDDVVTAFEAVASDYDHHCRAAREIAADYLRAETVIARLLADAGLS